MPPTAHVVREPQSAAAVLLVKPAHFQFNPETAASNAFQTMPHEGEPGAQNAQIAAEFDAVVAALRSHGILVVVAADSAAPRKPDAIFPNNWVSFHRDGRVVLYPMMAVNRRAERRAQIVEQVIRDGGFARAATVDLTHHEREQRYLEGTGSLVLDRSHGIAYACLSPRTDPVVVQDFAGQLGYAAVTFEACDESRRAIYHTNVLMSVGTDFAVICSEAIEQPLERATVLESLAASGRRVVQLSRRQMHEFAGNLLELSASSGKLIALSTRALASLQPSQRQVLEACATLLPLAIPTIEKIGGGGVRCMLAEVHLPEKLA